MATWTNKLKTRWHVKNTWTVVVILIVFACTGLSVLFIKQPLFEYWFPEGEKPLWATILYWILIFPVYNIFLLAYGFIFGQFKFFWEFEKRFFSRIFSRKRKET